MPVSDDFLTAGLKITGHFEDSEDPLGAVSGNFDQMGVSLGVLQWNIGQGSLQPIVKAIGKSVVTDTMPEHGEDLWRACNAKIAEGLAIVRAWQPNNKLPKAVFKELKAYVKCEPFQRQQLAVARRVGNVAWRTAVTWAQRQGRTEASKKEFCWFYDVYTQNGGLKSVTLQAVQNFIANHGTESVDNLICDWLAAQPPKQPGSIDARKNAKIWRDSVPSKDAILFVASYLRAMLSNTLWRADVLNRKGTIALGTGWVHKEEHNLRLITG